jgi:7-cyano-7-deazaguanine synthase
MKKAVVVLSGGQDSTTCLYWTIRKCGSAHAVQTVTFDYGQRHRVELESAKKVAAMAGVPNVVIPINSFTALGRNALTDSGVEVKQGVNAENNLPNTFVPGRNLIFLTLAAAFAYDRGITDLVTGVSQTDYSGYPDCRQDTIQAVERSLELGMERTFKIHTPLSNLTKAQSVILAQEVGAMEALVWSHTCYNGEYPPCGECPACVLRAKGFEEAGVEDPIYMRDKK